ncbi:MAG: SulP family inorganic anion transporter [Phycisphaeraceae bacterium]
MNDTFSPLALIKQGLTPAVHTIRTYSVSKFRHDLLAGLTVSVVEIPQAMAYAFIAGVPPEYGIYTSIIQGIIGALLSSSEHLATGPTNTQSLLIAAAVQGLVGDPANPIYLELVFGLTLLKGLIQLTFAFARMGKLIRYIGRSVILGVASGAGVLIVVGQLQHFLGIHLPAVHDESSLPGILATLHRVGMHVSEINVRAVAVGVSCLAVILLCKAISRFIPGSLIAVVASAAAVWAMGWTPAELAQVGDLPRSLPAFHVPQVSLSQAEALLPGALALALLGLIESVAIVKSIASHTGERIDPNQEFFAQGFKNSITSFFQCIPGSGSFTRSALDYEAGGKTRFAAVFNALFVMTIYLGLAPAAGRIPLASLAAVLFVIAYGLVDWRYFRRVVQTSRSDAVVFIITFLATLLLPLEYAVFTGIFLSLALYLHHASQLHIAEMVPTKTGAYLERPLHTREGGSGDVIFIQMEGDLFFALADELQDRLTDLTATGYRVVIFRLKRTHSIDATVLAVLESWCRQMQASGRYVILCGLKQDLLEKLKSYGLVDVIGRGNVFPTGFGVFTSAKAALQRARELVGSSIDVTGVDTSEEAEGWAYEI